MKSLVAHIGGIFIYAKNMRQLAEWYKQMLGIEYETAEGFNCFYTSFYYHPKENRDEKRYLAWSIMEMKGTEKPDEKFFVVNYRVHNMDKTIEHLKTNNVAIKGPEDYPEGRFAWITDCEGNAIELWEDISQPA